MYRISVHRIYRVAYDILFTIVFTLSDNFTSSTSFSIPCITSTVSYYKQLSLYSYRPTIKM